MAAQRPVMNVCVDWDNDGDFVDAGDDVTARVLSTAGIAAACGRDTARSAAPVSPGQAAFTLNNSSRDYYPDNASSPLAGKVLPGRPVRIQATQDATTSVLYRGFIDGLTILPNRADRSVQVTCLDALARVAGVTISTALYQGLRTGAAIGAILDAAGWPGAARDLDTGATQIRWWWEENTDAAAALQKVIAAEGPPAICYVDTSGNFVFRDRHHRLVRAASATSQATFTSAGAEPRYTDATVYEAGWDAIVNTITVPVEQREQAGVLAVVWQHTSSGTPAPAGTRAAAAGGAVITIGAGSTVDIIAQSSDPFTGAVTPSTSGFDENDTPDFVQLTGTTTASLSRTSGQSTIITLTDSGSGSSVAGLQMRAYPVPVTSTTQVSAADATSQDDYGNRGLPSGVDLGWCNPNDAAAVAAIYLAQYATRRPTVTIRLMNRNATVLTQQLTRDLSDRVTITDAELGLSGAEFHIDRIEYAAAEGGRVLSTAFACEKAPTTAQPLILDDATYGKLNTGGVLGI